MKMPLSAAHWGISAVLVAALSAGTLSDALGCGGGGLLQFNMAVVR